MSKIMAVCFVSLLQMKVEEEKLMNRQKKDKREMFRLLGQMKKKTKYWKSGDIQRWWIMPAPSNVIDSWHTTIWKRGRRRFVEELALEGDEYIIREDNLIPGVNKCDMKREKKFRKRGNMNYEIGESRRLSGQRQVDPPLIHESTWYKEEEEVVKMEKLDEDCESHLILPG